MASFFIAIFRTDLSYPNLFAYYTMHYYSREKTDDDDEQKNY